MQREAMGNGSRKSSLVGYFCSSSGVKKEKNLLIICGHYEGFDERINSIVDEEISIGDYV